MKYAVAIDIGGTNTRVALIDEKYKIEERAQFSTDADNPDITLFKIKQAIERFDKEIVGVGMSCPGPLDLIEGKILTTPNLAEAIIGEGKEYNIVQYLTVSTGLGAGLVINKKVFQGAHGFANEVANVCLWDNGPSHGSIYPGGVEAICSGTAIEQRAEKAGLIVAHAGEVNDLALKGNLEAQKIMDDAKLYLANFIAGIQAFIDPEIVILGGSVALKIPGFVEDVESLVKTKVYPVVEPLVKVRKSTLNEDSGLLGAACLAFNS